MLKAKTSAETDDAWTERVMAVASQRVFPVNGGDNGLAARKTFTKKAKEVIGDDI